MGTSKLLPVVLSSTLAAALAPRSASAAEVTEVAPPPAPMRRVGLMMDAGLPDGFNAALVYRPWQFLRAEAGGGYNLISPGVRAGATLIPFGWGPSFTAEAGRYFEGNANGLARKIAGSDFKDSALLERVGYDYANLHLGFEFGSRRMTFYLHGGMSYLRGKVHNADSVVQSQTAGLLGAGSEVSVKQDPAVKVAAPSAKFGIIVYLW